MSESKTDDTLWIWCFFLCGEEDNSVYIEFKLIIKYKMVKVYAGENSLGQSNANSDKYKMQTRTDK